MWETSFAIPQPGVHSISVHSQYSSVPTHPQAVVAMQPRGCFAKVLKNKPQFYSIGSAAVIIICGGLNMALSLQPMVATSVLLTSANPRFESAIYGLPTHVRISGFIAAILGALVSATFCYRLQNKLFFLSSSIVLIVSGILLVSIRHEIDVIIAARYLIGFANGLVLVPMFVMAGEESVKSMRGMIVSLVEVLCLTTGILVGVIINALWKNLDSDISIPQENEIFKAILKSKANNFTIFQLHGAINIFCGIIASIFAYLLTVESPVYFLVRGQEENAMNALQRLQYPFIVTSETHLLVEEHKSYIRLNKELSFSESAAAGLPALLKLSIYRGLIAISYSGVLNLGFFVFVFPSVSYSLKWLFILFGMARLIGALYACIKMDSTGRKYIMLRGACVCAALIIGAGIIFTQIKKHEGFRLFFCFIMIIIFQLCAGVFVSSSSPYLSEAFPLAIKPYYIAVAFSIEMLVQVIISLVDFEAVDAFLFIPGSIFIFFTLFGLVCFPETKNTTLQEAQAMFRKIRS